VNGTQPTAIGCPRGDPNELRRVHVAERTKLEEKLAEVTGLALAAEAAGGKVTRLTEKADGDLVSTLQKMAEEAAETAERCTELAGSFEGKKTAILEEAREVKKKASEMMATYLDKDADALDGFEFLTMAEAAEVGHWSVLKTLNQQAGNRELGSLIEWALPIQERHFQDVLQGSLKLAAEEDPSEPA
jgi:coenzyme F420-reducing hydrogenase alpha subunit